MLYRFVELPEDNELGIRKIGVMGAGPCGLSACKALEDAGLDYECLEASRSVGGVWNLESKTTGAYRSLHTNTSTHAMAYSDFPFGVDSPRHLPAAALQEYFERYATHFGLRPRIHFGQRVETARPLDGGGWRVKLANSEVRDYSALIVATGQYARPRWPEPVIPGDFSGERLHVFDYFDPATPVDCRGKRVVVVGLGSSAAELASELSDPKHEIGTASRVYLSARSGRWVINKIIDGKPIDVGAPHPATPLPGIFRVLPQRFGTWLMRRFLRVALGRMVARSGSPESLGLPVPSIEPWEERPTLSTDFIPALREGRIDVRPGIAAFEGERVLFTDGTSVEADVLLYATGYQLDFPFLSRETLGCDAPELALYQQVAHPEQENLFFLGCLRVGCSMWPVAEQQSVWVAKLLSGAFALPGPSVRRRRAVPLAGSLPVVCNYYIEGLRREAGGF